MTAQRGLASGRLSRFGCHGQEALLLSADGGLLVRLDLGLADGFRLRLLGLMGQPALTLGLQPQALLLRHCRSVHTCFMRAPIDIAFLDANGWVVQTHDNVGAWRVRNGRRPARDTLELPAGAVKLWQLGLGARLVGRGGRPVVA